MPPSRDLTAILDGVYAGLPREWTAKEGNFWFPSYRHYLEAIDAARADIARERGTDAPLDFLDIGLSVGVVGYGCTALGMRVTGVDDQKSTDHPIYRPLREKFGVTYADYDALVDALPFPDASFDVVNSNDMIEHIHGSPKRMLTECFRALRPGGRLVITTPNLGALHNRVLLLAGRSVHHSIHDWYHNPAWLRPRFTGHVREYTAGELRWMLGQAGFADVRVQPFNSMPGSASAPPGDAATLDYTGLFAYLRGHPFHERSFRLRGKRDLAFLAYRVLTAPFPPLRRDLLVVARRP